MGKSENYRAAERMVRTFEVSCGNLSVRQFILALELVREDPDLLLRVTKLLYPKVASCYSGATWTGVERNLRFARDSILKHANPERLERVFGYALRYSLSVGDMLDHICHYMDENGLWPD